MSTELLTRRMDLIHSRTNDSNINYLTMDTSYPARLSGIVIKVFRAVADYSTLDYSTRKEVSDNEVMFVVRNTPQNVPVVIPAETICTIPRKNVRNFDGSTFKTGDYRRNDYVVCVIDIATSSARMFSISSMYKQESDMSLDYHCNGKNDNVVLPGIVNTLIDVYDYTTNINYDQDELNYAITNNDKRIEYAGRDITINIIGKFGIDYSKTDFVYGKFNRQNRSSIMKIAGTGTGDVPGVTERHKVVNSYSDNNIVTNDRNVGLVLNWEKCYIPNIEFSSNEILSAMFNQRLNHYDANGNPIYIDYWKNKNNIDKGLSVGDEGYEDPYVAHFTDENGNAYGNLYPRRLVFCSIEGYLPLNITFKNFCLNTFGVGIYCETESKKRIKLIDSKITLLGLTNYISTIVPQDNADITTRSDMYNNFRGFIPAPCAVDCNAYNPIFVIDNCVLGDYAVNSGYGQSYTKFISNMIMNSSRDMRVTNSQIKGVDKTDTNGFKFSYVDTYPDFEYNPEYQLDVDASTFALPGNAGTVHANNFTPAQLANPNVVDVAIMSYLFGVNVDAAVDNYAYNALCPNKKITCTDPSVLVGENDCLANVADLAGRTLNGVTLLSTPSSSGTMSKAKLSVTSKTEGIRGCMTYGFLKNLPVIYRTSGERFYLNDDLQNKANDRYTVRDFETDPAITYPNINEYSNSEVVFMPKLIIDGCTVQNDGILYNYNGYTKFSNTQIKCHFYDALYTPDQITIASGQVDIDNCDIVFDTRCTYCYNATNTWLGTSNIALIHVKGNISESPIENSSNSLTSSIICDPAVVSYTSPKLKMSDTKCLIIADYKYNLPSTVKQMNDSGVDVYRLRPRSDGDSIYGDINCPSISLNFIKSHISDTRNNTININSQYFNPLTAPNISIDHCDFDVLNDFTRTEYNDMGNPDDSEFFTDINSVATTILVGTGIKNKVNAEPSSAFYASLPESPSDTQYETLLASAESGNYVNLVKQNYNFIDPVLTSGDDTYARCDYNHSTVKCIVKHFDLTSANIGKMTTIIYFNGTVEEKYKKVVHQYDINTTRTTWQKLMDMDACYILEFWKALANRYGQNTFTVNDYGEILDSNNNRVNYSDVNNYLFISQIYGAELPMTGAYITKSAEDYARVNQYNELDSEYGGFGLIAFNLANCVFNISDSNIGKVHGNMLRHTYASELMLRRSPRVAFKFMNNGQYKVQNTNVSAWATTVWSNLNYDFSSINKTNEVSGILANSTSINLSRGFCKIENSELLNYSAVHHIYGAPDVKALFLSDPSLSNVSESTLVDNNTQDTKDANDYQCKYPDVNAYTNEQQAYFEAYINANTCPIIYIHNSAGSNTDVSKCTIYGNQILITAGNVDIEGCTYINETNANMINAIDRSPEISTNYFNQDLSSIIRRNAPINLTLRDNKIILIKDVIANKYVDPTRMKDMSTGTPYLIDKSMTPPVGINIENIYGNFTFKGNHVIFKCNSYHKKYGVLDNATSAFIKYSNGPTKGNNVLVDGNDVNMAFAPPIVYTGDDVLAFKSNQSDIIPNVRSRITRSMPNKTTAFFMFDSFTYEAYYVPSLPQDYPPLNIPFVFTNNKFLITTPINKDNVIILPTSRTTNNVTTYDTNVLLKGNRLTDSDEYTRNYNTNFILYSESKFDLPYTMNGTTKNYHRPITYYVPSGVDGTNKTSGFDENSVIKTQYFDTTLIAATSSGTGTDKYLVSPTGFDDGFKNNVISKHQSITYAGMLYLNGITPSIKKNNDTIVELSDFINMSNANHGSLGDYVIAAQDMTIGSVAIRKDSLVIFRSVRNSTTLEYTVGKDKSQLDGFETVYGPDDSSSTRSAYNEVYGNSKTLRQDSNGIYYNLGQKSWLRYSNSADIPNASFKMIIPFSTPVFYSPKTMKVNLNMTNNVFLNNDSCAISAFKAQDKNPVENVNYPKFTTYDGDIIFLTSSVVVSLFQDYPAVNNEMPNTVNVSNNIFFKNISKSLLYNNNSTSVSYYSVYGSDSDYTRNGLILKSVPTGTGFGWNIDESYLDNDSEENGDHSRRYTYSFNDNEYVRNGITYSIEIGYNYNKQYLQQETDAKNNSIDPTKLQFGYTPLFITEAINSCYDDSTLNSGEKLYHLDGYHNSAINANPTSGKYTNRNTVEELMKYRTKIITNDNSFMEPVMQSIDDHYTRDVPKYIYEQFIRNIYL